MTKSFIKRHETFKNLLLLGETQTCLNRKENLSLPLAPEIIHD